MAVLNIKNMTIWFNKINNGITSYCSKSIMFGFYPQHWRLVSAKSNGAIKGKDSCFDYNVWFLGFHFAYTNWSYNISGRRYI